MGSLTVTYNVRDEINYEIANIYCTLDITTQNHICQGLAWTNPRVDNAYGYWPEHDIILIKSLTIHHYTPTQHDTRNLSSLFRKCKARKKNTQTHFSFNFLNPNTSTKRKSHAHALARIRTCGWQKARQFIHFKYNTLARCAMQRRQNLPVIAHWLFSCCCSTSIQYQDMYFAAQRRPIDRVEYVAKQQTQKMQQLVEWIKIHPICQQFTLPDNSSFWALLFRTFALSALSRLSIALIVCIFNGFLEKKKLNKIS